MSRTSISLKVLTRSTNRYILLQAYPAAGGKLQHEAQYTLTVYGYLYPYTVQYVCTCTEQYVRTRIGRDSWVRV